MHLCRTSRNPVWLSYQSHSRLHQRFVAGIYPRLPVTLHGFKAEINQTLWLVKEAMHTLADSGLVTALELEVRDDPTTCTGIYDAHH